ncbi:PAB-dependent poly(A)-specific ribonuclease subunit 3 [Elasticomyces elasticus]|nr:PAB-dependent poly(A)-specific ribonuclease subunit 3 [Elasticomyces elasticus]
MDPGSQDARNHNDQDPNTTLTSAGLPRIDERSSYRFNRPLSELREDPSSPFYRYGENRSLNQRTHQRFADSLRPLSELREDLSSPFYRHGENRSLTQRTPQRIASSESRSRDQDFPPLPGLRGQDPVSEPPRRSDNTSHQFHVSHRPISELREDPLSPFYRHGENRSLTTWSSPRRVASTGQTTSSKYPSHGVHGVQIETTKSKNKNKKHKRGTRGLRLSSLPPLDDLPQDASPGTSAEPATRKTPTDLKNDPSSEFYGQAQSTIHRVIRSRAQLPEHTPPRGPRASPLSNTAPGRLLTGEEYLAGSGAGSGSGSGSGRGRGRGKPPVWEFDQDTPKNQAGLPSDPRRKASTPVLRDPYRANTNPNSPVADSNPAPHSSAPPPPHFPVPFPPSDTSSEPPALLPIQSCSATTSNTPPPSKNTNPISGGPHSSAPQSHHYAFASRRIVPLHNTPAFQQRPSNDSFEPVKITDTELVPWGPSSIDTRPTGHGRLEQGVNLSVPPLDTNFRTNSPIFHGPATTSFAPFTVKLPPTNSFAPTGNPDLDPASQRLDSVDSTIRSVWPSRSDMAAGGGFPMQSGDARRHPSASASNHRGGNGGGRFGSASANVSVAENQRPMSSQLCRNGPQCRKYQEGTCHYNHDFGSMQQQQQQNNGLTVSVVTIISSWFCDLS